MTKLGLIAGGGGLPLEILAACQAADRPVFVIRVKGFADPALAAFEGADCGLAEFGKALGALKGAGCQAVCFAGVVKRPDFSTLVPDLRGMTVIPGAVAAAAKGDDALLRYILGVFEREGFAVEGADHVVSDLAVGLGPMGRHEPRAADHQDIACAMRAARALGQLDIGQGAVSARGVILALEAQEGTDAMLSRCAELPLALRGAPEARIGVLAKSPKPIQDRRVDLPTIGPDTVLAAVRAGLAGIVGEAGGLLVVDRAAVIAAADDLGLFIVGLPHEGR